MHGAEGKWIKIDAVCKKQKKINVIEFGIREDAWLPPMTYIGRVCQGIINKSADEILNCLFRHLRGR